MARTGISVSIILPTYNESGNILKLIDEISKVLKAKKTSFEVIVVDDNSPDKTGLLVQKYYAKVPYIRAIIRKKEKGLATAIRYGIEHAVGDFVLVMDTDFNHSPTVIPKMVAKTKRYDFVVGSRYIQGGGMENRKRYYLSLLFNYFVRATLSSPVHDNLSGYFVASRKKLLKLDFDKIFWGYGDYFIRLIYIAKESGMSFSEVPSFYKDREYGESKSQFFQMFLDYSSSVLSLRFRKKYDYASLS